MKEVSTSPNAPSDARIVPTPPGATLQQEIDAAGITQAGLAARIGLSAKHVNQVMKGGAPITPETAIKLEHILGVPASFWLSRESNYREDLARAEERVVLTEQVGWLKSLHAEELTRRGYIKAGTDSVDRLRELLRFFRIPSFASFTALTGASGNGVAFRAAAAHESDPYAVVTWLRVCEHHAENAICQPFDETAFREALNSIRQLTTRNDSAEWIPELLKSCAAVGVAVVLEPSIGKTRLNGAAWWATPTKAIIGLTGRHKRADIFWFTFFHEAAHLLLHSKKETWVDLSANESGDPATASIQEIEREADRFASNRLIPPEHQTELQSLGLTESAIRDFAAAIGVGADIVLGRLQHDQRIPFRSPLNKKLLVPHEPEALSLLAHRPKVANSSDAIE